MKNDAEDLNIPTSLLYETVERRDVEVGQE